MKSNDISKYIENITSFIKKGINNTIPHKLVTIKLHEPAWINNFRKCKIRQRKRLYKKGKNSNSPNHWSNFKRARNEVIDLIRKSKQKYIDSLSDKLRSGSFSSRDWWKTLKGFISPSSSSSISPLYDTINDTIVLDEIEKANLLNSFFVLQSSLDDAVNLVPNEGIRNGEYSLNSIRINPSEVKDILKTIKVGNASGPDGINIIVLSQAANELATPLRHFFNFPLESCSLPFSWKTSNVCPIFKSGDPSIPSNYRLLSLLNTMETSFRKNNL